MWVPYFFSITYIYMGLHCSIVDLPEMSIGNGCTAGCPVILTSWFDRFDLGQCMRARFPAMIVHTQIHHLEETP
jgi:hypothetical protein